jgi:hydroxymethylbilane synthase
MPLAAHATVQGEYLTLSAAWVELEAASPLVTAKLTAEVADLLAAEALGEQVAQMLIDSGARVMKPV